MANPQRIVGLHRGEEITLGYIHDGEEFRMHGVAEIQRKAHAYSAVTVHSYEFWTRGAAELWLRMHGQNHIDKIEKAEEPEYDSFEFQDEAAA